MNHAYRVSISLRSTWALMIGAAVCVVAVLIANGG